MIIGTKIFNKDELDENNEIPAPFLIDDNEFDMFTKPDLLPQPKHDLLPQPKSKANKPPKPSAPKQFKKKNMDTNSKWT